MKGPRHGDGGLPGRSARSCLWFFILLVLAPAAWTAETDGGPQPIQRELQDLGAPWYDSETDSWRRVGIRPPESADPDDEDDDDQESSSSDWFTSDGWTIPTAFTWMMYILIAALLVALLGWLVLNLRQGLTTDNGRHGGPARAPPPDLSVLPFETERDLHPDEALDAALQEQDWNRAVLWLFAVQLFLLERHGFLRLQKGKTNRAYLRELDTASGDIGDSLRRTIEVFERVRFGGLATDRTTVQDLLARHERFAELVGRGGL